MHPRRCLSWLLAAAWFVILSSTDIAASEFDPRCTGSPSPAASLLLPYFEVDLDDPQGKTTMISVGSRAASPQLARVVLWTDWGRATASFDLLIPPSGLVPLNLRDVLVGGVLPTASANLERPPNCAAPLAQPSLDPDELAAKHTGLEFPAASNQCWGSSGDDASVAVGFVTIDALESCSETIRFPYDEGYFAADESALASQDNVLFGDFILVEPRNNIAQGAALVHLQTMASSLPVLPRSFYEAFLVEPEHDLRRPLPLAMRARFLQQRGTAGSTSYLLWHGGYVFDDRPTECPSIPTPRQGNGRESNAWQWKARDDSGENVSTGRLVDLPKAARIDVSSDALIYADGNGGSVILEPLETCQYCRLTPPRPPRPVGGVVIPLLGAEGRFSVAVEPFDVAGVCD